jgi:hypothetical protein
VHTVTFYPVGCGDSSQIVLANGRRILMDFHHIADTEVNNRPEINLANQLREELAEASRDYYDIAAFTHGDEDHIKASSDFLELEHADKYCGAGRIKVRELWLPAAMVVEDVEQDKQLTDRALLRKEALYRLRQGKGIRIFSKPELLKDKLAVLGIDFESRKHLFVDAGTLVPGFSIAADGVEFFVHSPFVAHTDQGDDLRNTCALIFNVRFLVDGTQTDYLAIGDSEYGVLEEIVGITEAHGRMDRLAWDLYNIPHHCSYLALGPEKGAKETVPVDRVRQLLMQGRSQAYLISSSDPIDTTCAAYEQTLPPHVQAKNAYESHLKQVRGRRFLVTMEEPNRAHPKPLIFEITGGGCNWRKAAISGVASVIGSRPPRAG